MTPLAHVSETMKHWFDAGAVGGAVAAYFGWLPEITALVVLVWTLLRLFETWQNIQINRRKLRGD